MTEPLLAFILLTAASAVSFGAARIVSWLLDRRDYTVLQQSREAQVITLARAEIAATFAEEQERAA